MKEINMLKILMVSEHFNLQKDSIPIGGVQKHITYVSNELLNRGHKVFWEYRKNVLNNLTNIKPDIVISHDFPSFIEGIKIPQIVIFHGYEGDVPPKEHIKNLRLRIEKQASKSICVGKYLLKWYGHNPDKVFWGGVEETPVINLKKENNILYLGRLDTDQQPLRIFEALGRTDQSYNITVCAEGSLKREIQAIVKKYKLKVTFKGFVCDPCKYIEKANVVICSGYLSILESYIQKKPVVSSYGNDLKKDYLSLLPRPPIYKNTVEEIAESIDYVFSCLETGSFQKEIEKNYRFAKENTWKKVVDQYEELFKCILK